MKHTSSSSWSSKTGNRGKYFHFASRSHITRSGSCFSEQGSSKLLSVLSREWIRPYRNLWDSAGFGIISLSFSFLQLNWWVEFVRTFPCKVIFHWKLPFGWRIIHLILHYYIILCCVFHIAMNTVYGRSYIVSGFWMQVAISTQGTEERNARLSQLIHSNISCAKASFKATILCRQGC